MRKKCDKNNFKKVESKILELGFSYAQTNKAIYTGLQTLIQ
jgi:hypothetical protein